MERSLEEMLVLVKNQKYFRRRDMVHFPRRN